MKKIFIIITLFLCFTVSKVLSQKSHFQKPIYSFSPVSTDDIPDSVTLFFRKGPLIKNEAGERMTIVPKVDGSFCVSPSFYQPVYWFQIIFWYSKPYQHSVSDYYAEPGDQLMVRYKKPKGDINLMILPKMNLAFLGRGAAKFKVLNILSNIKTDLGLNLDKAIKAEFGNTAKSKDDKINSNEYFKSPELHKYLASVLNEVKLANKRTNDTLQKYKAQTGGNIATYFGYELASSPYFPFWMDYLFQISKSESFKNEITKFYFLNKNLIIEEPTDSLVKYSKEYKHNKLVEIMYETTFRAKGGTIRFQDQYDAIKSIKNIELRNILITFFIHQPWFQSRITDKEKQDSCIADALTFIKAPELRQPLREQLVFFEGSKVPNFSFNDENGKTFTLADLSGKVFMIDFYFLGCKGCIQFANKFKNEVYPKFAAERNFKVVSVSIDKNREQWMKARKSGLYNEKSYINLSAGSFQWHHPFLQHYGATSFPFILLVDKNGRLITKIDTHSSVVISALIKKALSDIN